MQDNSELEQKIKIRKKALDLLGKRPRLVVDLFAGEGVITNMLWSRCADKVIAIEKDFTKAQKIKCSEVYVGDNKNFFHLCNNADIVDVDAYGMAMPIIERFPKGVIVVFTDGTPEKARKIWSANTVFFKESKRLLGNLNFEKSHAGNAFYGFGVRK